MRNELSRSLVASAEDAQFVFLTGDLGYNALEPLQAAAGARFINAGIAEQNMISVAAGMAATGLRPWTYSIAPFIYARPFEQIRNDVCMHDLPVKLIGNGGGYGYGVMGGTHHALEDYGALLCLRNMNVFVPAFGEDVAPIVSYLTRFDHPAYLRLGRDEKPKDFELPPYDAWRRVLPGNGPTLLVAGPIAGSLLTPLAALPDATRPDTWVVTELPLCADTIPSLFLDSLACSQRLIVVEEHVAQGGVGQSLAHLLLKIGLSPRRFTHHHAIGYVSGNYGSQEFHRRESELHPAAVLAGL